MNSTHGKPETARVLCKENLDPCFGDHPVGLVTIADLNVNNRRGSILTRR